MKWNFRWKIDSLIFCFNRFVPYRSKITTNSILKYFLAWCNVRRKWWLSIEIDALTHKKIFKWKTKSPLKDPYQPCLKWTIFGKRLQSFWSIYRKFHSSSSNSIKLEKRNKSDHTIGNTKHNMHLTERATQTHKVEKPIRSRKLLKIDLSEICFGSIKLQSKLISLLIFFFAIIYF